MLRTRDKMKPIIIEIIRSMMNAFSIPSAGISFKIAGRIQTMKPSNNPQINIPRISLKNQVLIPCGDVSPSKNIQKKPVKPKAINQKTRARGIPLVDNTANVGFGNS